MVALTEDLVYRVGVVVLLAAALVALWWFERPRGRIGRTLRSRFAMGIPWGSLTVVAGVVAFYLVFQHGLQHWYRPVTLPYRSWSYLYPLGVLTGAFAHSGSGHLVGNVTAALVVMPLAEYAFGHFPRERGSQSFATPLSNPWIRAFVIFPGGVVVVGLLTSLFSWGPIIGFSGVVYAAAGFALVRYPLATIVALVAQGSVRFVYRAVLDPVIFREASTTFQRPWWAGIAAQGHALGLFLGVLLGVLVLYRRGLIDVPRVGSRASERPSALRLWLGTLLAGVTLNVWLVWWYRGGDSYVLYRAVGLWLVLAITVVVTAAVRASDRPLVGEGLTRRQTVTLVLVVPLATMSLVAVPVNLATVDDASAPAGTAPIEVRDYRVAYAEDVPNQMVTVVDVELFGETTRVNTSGVIVVSERRHVWTTQVSKSRLAHSGRARVVLGGPGWREAVEVRRLGWSAVGGPTAYHVWLAREDGPARHAFASDPAAADLVVAGRNVSVAARVPDADAAPGDEWFALRVTRNGSTVGSAPIPGENETVTAGGVTFVRDGRAVVATVDDTRVTVARQEQYG